MSGNDAEYRSCAGIMLLSRPDESGKKRVFVGKRIDTTAEAWQMPQGGIKNGEAPEKAALRELKEEVGTSRAEIVAEYGEWLYYDLPQEIVGKLWNGKYKGQKQKWFVMQFTGSDSDINIKTRKPEFRDWRWAMPEELPEIIVPFKRDIYSRLLNEFRQFFTA